MHLIERYALACGAHIGRPFIYEKFFPMTVDKYITLHPNSKFPAKCYDYWQDVVNLIYPVLSKLGYTIVQIGTKDDKRLKYCYVTSGQTNIGQVANILAKTELHLGADSFASHIASGYGKKIVCLYSNNYIEAVKPYWSRKEDCILLEPDRGENKPNFSAEESPKTINEIRPEDIANSVFKLLKIDECVKEETVFVGQHYGQQMLEMVPNQIVDPKQFGLEILTVRMDFLFDEKMLIEQAKRSGISIVTNKPISKFILDKFRGNIKDVVYEIDANHNPDFAKTLQDCNLPFFLISRLPEEQLRDIKLAYLDYGIIHIRGRLDETLIKQLKDLNRPLSYKSSKFLLSDGKIYPSKAAWVADVPVTDTENEVSLVIDNEDFWRELECYRIISTTK